MAGIPTAAISAIQLVYIVIAIVAGDISESFDVTTGVLQGLLAPFLFHHLG